MGELLPFANYFLALFLFTIKPGPGILFYISSSLAEGASASFVRSVGSSFIHGVIAFVLLLGAGYISSYPQVLFVVQFCASLFIGYLGIKTWINAGKVSVRTRSTEIKGHLQRMGEGIIWSATNPTNIAFYAALVPVFMSSGSSVSFSYAGLIAVLTSLTVFSGLAPYILIADKAQVYFRKESTLKRLQKVSAVVFVGISILLIYSSVRNISGV